MRQAGGCTHRAGVLLRARADGARAGTLCAFALPPQYLNAAHKRRAASPALQAQQWQSKRKGTLAQPSLRQNSLGAPRCVSASQERLQKEQTQMAALQDTPGCPCKTICVQCSSVCPQKLPPLPNKLTMQWRSRTSPEGAAAQAQDFLTKQLALLHSTMKSPQDEGRASPCP